MCVVCLGFFGCNFLSLFVLLTEIPEEEIFGERFFYSKNGSKNLDNSIFIYHKTKEKFYLHTYIYTHISVYSGAGFHLYKQSLFACRAYQTGA